MFSDFWVLLYSVKSANIKGTGLYIACVFSFLAPPLSIQITPSFGNLHELCQCQAFTLLHGKLVGNLQRPFTIPIWL